MTKEENKLYNFDLPATIDADLFESDISKLMRWETVFQKEYTFNNPNVIPRILEIKPAPIIIVEGLFILHFKKIANDLDMTIFIDADEEIALTRRLKRDLAERGYSNEDARYKWHIHVVPAYKKFLLPFKETFDKIVVNNGHVADHIMEVTGKISEELREKVLG